MTAQATNPYAVMGVGSGEYTMWRVTRMPDLAQAGYISPRITDDGARVNVPVPREWTYYAAAQHFADNIGQPQTEGIWPLAWLDRDGKVLA